MIMSYTFFFLRIWGPHGARGPGARAPMAPLLIRHGMLNENAITSTVVVNGHIIEKVADTCTLVRRSHKLGISFLRSRDGFHGKVTGNIMKSRKASMNINKKVHNEYVLPVMVYGSDTWALKKAHMELLSVAQRIMLGITLRDHKRNTWIRHQTCINAIIDVIKKGIRGRAGHIARFKDNRWTQRVTEWTPREWTRRQGRPKTRCRDNLIRHLVPAWPRIARDRRLWRQFREGCLVTE